MTKDRLVLTFSSGLDPLAINLFLGEQGLVEQLGRREIGGHWVVIVQVVGNTKRVAEDLRKRKEWLIGVEVRSKDVGVR